MTATAVLLYDSYKAQKTWRGNRAVLLYYVSGLANDPSPDEALAATGLAMGQQYPFEGLKGAPLIDLQLVERPIYSKAWVLAVFDGTAIQWGGNGTRLLVTTDSQIIPYEIPVYSRDNVGTPGQPYFQTILRYTVVMDRAKTIRRQYKFVDGAIADSTIDFITTQYGKRYRFGGVDYLLIGCNARSNPNGASVLTTVFYNTGSLLGCHPGTSWNVGTYQIPDLGPLDELKVDVDNTGVNSNGASPYSVVSAESKYPLGAPLP